MNNANHFKTLTNCGKKHKTNISRQQSLSSIAICNPSMFLTKSDDCMFSVEVRLLCKEIKNIIGIAIEHFAILHDKIDRLK